MLEVYAANSELKCGNLKIPTSRLFANHIFRLVLWFLVNNYTHSSL